MKKYGITKDGKLIEKFDDVTSAVIRFKECANEEGIGFRSLEFEELTEEEKLETMEERLTDLTDFADSIKDIGTMSHSSTRVSVEELRWLIENTKQNSTNDLAELEKVQEMEARLAGLIKYLEDMQGSGHTYYSSTTIGAEELNWLIDNTKKHIIVK